MIENVEFVKEHYSDQIAALNGFIKDAFPHLPNRNNSLIRFGGGTALAMYYFQHRLSFDIDLFVTDVQVLNYLSPKHWIEETTTFNAEKYIDLSNHIRVLYKENNIKVDILVTADENSKYLHDDSYRIFTTDIYVESIENIIAKKIVYRRNDNLTRDIIDIAISIKHANNILKKLYDEKMIKLNDVKELYDSIKNLDITTYKEEIEIVMPFQKYIEDANNAPQIIINECENILYSHLE